jgi:hypothetical protein
VGFNEARAEEADKVFEGVRIAGGGEGLFGAIAMAAEAGAVAVFVADGRDAGAALRDAGIERRVNVDQRDGGGFERVKGGEVFAVEDAVHGMFIMLAARLRRWCWRCRGGVKIAPTHLQTARRNGAPGTRAFDRQSFDRLLGC